MNSNKKIFIIEDDPFYSALLQSFLKLKGFWDIHIFSSGRGALANLADGPDLILLDYDLGDAEYPGKQVLQEIKMRSDKLPVIFISG
ncbi:MAG: response regulator, partial [Bacteroidota bacterium]